MAVTCESDYSCDSLGGVDQARESGKIICERDESDFRVEIVIRMDLQNKIKSWRGPMLFCVTAMEQSMMLRLSAYS